MLRQSIRYFQLILVMWTLSVAASSPTIAHDSDIILPSEELVVHSKRGEHKFTVEVASTEDQRARGLMFRERMALNAGMLFVFEAAGERYFWMKNTPLSLDILFIGEDGRIKRIAEGTTPFSEQIIPSEAPALSVLELLAGTSRRLGIALGDQVVAPSLK